MENFGPLDHVTLQDLKATHISETELDQIAALVGSYEALFNRRSRLYTSQGLKERKLSEADFKELILSHYTFLKRPLIRVHNEVFVGYKKQIWKLQHWHLKLRLLYIKSLAGLVCEAQ